MRISYRLIPFIIILLLHPSTIFCQSSQVGLLWHFNKFVNLSGRKDMTPFRGTGVGVRFKMPIEQQARNLTFTFNQVILTGTPRESQDVYPYYDRENPIEYECDLLNFSVAVEELLHCGKVNLYFGMGLMMEKCLYFSKTRYFYLLSAYDQRPYVESTKIEQIQNDYRGATQLSLGLSLPISKTASLEYELVCDAYLFNKMTADDNLKQNLLFSSTIGFSVNLSGNP